MFLFIKQKIEKLKKVPIIFNTPLQDVMDYAGEKGDLPYPIIADEKRNLAVKLGMVDPDEKDAKGLPLTCRAVSCF